MTQRRGAKLEMSGDEVSGPRNKIATAQTFAITSLAMARGAILTVNLLTMSQQLRRYGRSGRDRKV